VDIKPITGDIAHAQVGGTPRQALIEERPHLADEDLLNTAPPQEKAEAADRANALCPRADLPRA
jgi:hypothetical protein